MRKKLRLNADTLRVLDAGQAKNIVGGNTVPETHCVCESQPCQNTNDTCQAISECWACQETENCTLQPTCWTDCSCTHVGCTCTYFPPC